jgi:hypothetical protein
MLLGYKPLPEKSVAYTYTNRAIAYIQLGEIGKAKADLDAIFGLANVPREVSVQPSELLREIS